MARLKLIQLKWLQHLLFLVCLLVTKTSGQYNNQQADHPNNFAQAGHPNNFERQQALLVRNQKAKKVLELINTEADPCKDFYDFACGKWAEIHAPTNAGEVTTPQSELEVQVNAVLQTILSQAHKESSAAEQKVLSFYHSCYEVEKTSPAQRTFMLDFVRHFGGLPSMPSTNWHVNYDWLGIVTRLRAIYGLDVLINFEMGYDENMREAIYLSEPKTTIIPPENCSAVAMETMNLRDEGYEAIQEEISKNMQRWLSMQEDDARRFGGDVVRFEFELCKKMRLEQSLPEEEEEKNVGFDRNSRRNQKSATEQNHTFRINQLSNFENAINFRHYLETILNVQIGNNRNIYLRSMEYFKHLARIIRAAEKPTIANYLMYRVLSVLNFPSDDRKANRGAYCVQQVQKHFPEIVGEMYSRYVQRNELLNRAENFYFTKIRDALEESLKEESFKETAWLSRQAYQVAVQKIKRINSGFPSYQNLDINDLRMDQPDYWHKLQAVMIYNTQKYKKNPTPETIQSFDVATKLIQAQNKVLIGQALLQPPFAHPNYAVGMNFAVLGQRIARELALAFDEQGWQPDSLSRQPLDEYTADGLRNQTECYRTQYSNYLHNNPQDFRNASRLREIIADSNGLNVAFRAYLNWLKEIEPMNLEILKLETLPNVDFTNTQLFFIQFAQTRCFAKYGEEEPPEFLPLDRHTPERYDVNGPLSNFIEFSREFGCRPGDEMSLGDKCTIF